jgi:oxalate decarboxylase/phosphoglucose isomerase-like protein (cupin superfamily)
MKQIMTVGLVVLGLSFSAVYAQDAKPSYESAPENYKVIFQDQNYRVIEASWKPGATDKPHTHPVPSVIYFVTDCKLNLHNPDGKIVEANVKAGKAAPVPIVTNYHTAENVGAAECRSVVVEHK